MEKKESINLDLAFFSNKTINLDKKGEMFESKKIFFRFFDFSSFENFFSSSPKFCSSLL